MALPLNLIADERTRQIVELGYDIEHDDQHNPSTWSNLLAEHVGKTVKTVWTGDIEYLRQEAIIIGAVAVAILDWCNRQDEAEE